MAATETMDWDSVNWDSVSWDSVNWGAMSADEFWTAAERLQEQTLAHAEDLFAFVETATPDQLRSILTQYRFFTIYYIPDLAILIARLEDGRLRTFLADILSDELGYGDPLKAHAHLYDEFLRTLGVTEEDLDSQAIRENVELLDRARLDLMSPAKNSTYGVGLRGMGGECVCQIYLARLYEHVIKNPYIEKNRPFLSWEFWDLHVGEHDIQHRLKTRALINEEVVVKRLGSIGDLGRGYYDSMVSWRGFWNNILASVESSDVERCRIRPDATFDLLAAAS